MSKAFILVSAILVGGTVGGLSAEAAPAAKSTSADASNQAQCSYLATLEFYTGKQRSKFIRQCLASNSTGASTTGSGVTSTNGQKSKPAQAQAPNANRSTTGQGNDSYAIKLDEKYPNKKQ